jgi:dGTPase
MPAKGELVKQRDAAAYIRTAAIGALVEIAGAAFAERWPYADTGKPQDLLDSTPASEEIRAARTFARERCYQAKQVMYLELSGHNVLHRLLDLMELAAFRTAGKNASERGKKIANLLRWGEEANELTEYQRMHRALDVVSGMTDRYAVNFCKKVYGVTLPRQH